MCAGTSQAARYLRAHGITLFGVREESIKLLGKADMYFFSPEHPPLTEPAQKALDWAVNEKQKTGMHFFYPLNACKRENEVSPSNYRHMLYHVISVSWNSR